MRLARVEVRHFQCIESAVVELGPGLNVLYGPNDLGKSSLAAAVRAALLLQHSTTASDAFVPWHLDVRPFVEVVLQGDDDRYYRVRKTFGTSSKGSSTLDVSNDGVQFSNEAKGREVDGRLRELLGWGLSSPGGNRGSRGMPESFLTHVLLAAQTDVPGILARSLTDDPGDSGRERLNQALAALAEDPLFKRVLDQAQNKVDQAYTPTGRRRGGKHSPFTQHQNRIKGLQEELDGLRRTATAGNDIRQALHQAVAERDELLTRREAADAAVQDARKRLEQTQAHRKAQEALLAAQSNLNAMQAKQQELQQLEQAISPLQAARNERRQAKQEQDARVDNARRSLEAARERLRTAQADDADQQRALALEKLDNEALQQEAALKAAEHRERDARTALETLQLVAKERAATIELREKLAQADRAATEAKQTKGEVAARRSLLRVLEGYGELREARRALQRAEETLSEAKDLEQRAEQRREEAREASQQRAALRLPDPAQVERLQHLRQQLDVAEARLGGGLSVAVRLKQSLELRAVVDGKPVEPGEDRNEWRLEGERELQLQLGDVAQVDIAVGEAEARAEAEALRKQWAAEGAPALETAGVDSFIELTERHKQATALAQQEREATQAATNLAERAEAKRLETGDLTTLRAAVEDREKETPGRITPEIEAQLEAMGDQWRARTQQLHDDLSKTADEATQSAGKAGERLAELRATLGAAEQQHAKSSQEADEARRKLGEEEPQVALDGAVGAGSAARDAITALKQQKAELADAGKAQVQLAEQGVQDAESALKEALQTQEQMHAAEREAGERLVAHEARIQERRTAVEALDFEAARKQVDAENARLAETPLPEPPADEQQVASLTQTHQELAGDAARKAEEITKLEGRLEESGGEALSERVRETERALNRAKEEEAELHIDFKAWRLLADTLREAENLEGAHLGRRLAEPVSARFQQLTGKRYGTLGLDPHLAATGLEVRGGARDIGALSVGTQDQLATLFRLCIAEELQSALILDDHLAQSDSGRIGWFRTALREAAQQVQIVVLTCRPEDYLLPGELPAEGAPTAVRGGGLLQAVNLERVIERDRPSMEPQAQAGI